MIEKELNCHECEAEFSVEHDELDEPSYCPFCGSRLKIEDKDNDEDDSWDEVDEGC